MPQVKETRNEAFVPECGTGVRGRLDKFPLDCIHHCFQAIVSAEFLVDVMEVIAEGLWANTQCTCNIIAVFAFGEKAQHVLFLIG